MEIRRENAALGIIEGPVEAKLAIARHVHGLAAEFEISNWGKVSVITSIWVDELKSAIAVAERARSALADNGYLESDSFWFSKSASIDEYAGVTEIFLKNCRRSRGRPRRSHPPVAHLDLARSSSIDPEDGETKLFKLWTIFDEVNDLAHRQQRAQRLQVSAHRIASIHKALMSLRIIRRPARTTFILQDDFEPTMAYEMEDSDPGKELKDFVRALEQSPFQEIAHLLIDDLSAYVRERVEQELISLSIYDASVTTLLACCHNVARTLNGRPTKLAASAIVGEIMKLWRELAGPGGKRITVSRHKGRNYLDGECVQLVRSIAELYDVDLPLRPLHLAIVDHSKRVVARP